MRQRLISTCRRLRQIGKSFRPVVVGLAVIATLVANCASEGTPPTGVDVLSGMVTGQVTVDGAGRPGVTVTLRTGSTTIATTQTGSGGTYIFENVVTQAKTVAITPPAGTTCDLTQREVTVTEGGTVAADFACTTPPLQTGTVTGTVIVDGVGTSGVVVFLRDQAKVLATTTTGPGGTYQFSHVVVGTLAVSIEWILRSGASCPTTQLNVMVPAGGTGTANFECLGPRGTVTGRVTLDGAAVSGVALTLHDGTTLIATTTTDQAGIYQFSNVTLGMRVLSIAKPAGTNCTRSQLNIPVSARTTHTVDFACITLPPPPPTPSPFPEMPSPDPRPVPPPPPPPPPPTRMGTVYGRVTLNGVGVGDVEMTLIEGYESYGEIVATTRTRSNGTYVFEVAWGAYVVVIDKPPEWGCSRARGVAVNQGSNQGSGFNIADFTCTMPG